jgi:hypothetical protein
MSDHCVRCQCSIVNAKELGSPSIYGSPDEWDLCGPCFHDEDREIEERGTNDLPDVFEAYRHNYEANG